MESETGEYNKYLNSCLCFRPVQNIQIPAVLRRALDEKWIADLRI